MEGSEWAAMAAASMQALGQMGNAYMAAKASDDDRAFAAKMYDRQRQDALSDWNMMNEYNDPSNVMARLARAGLNPNLAISKGVDASAAAPVRASSANNMASGRTPQFNMDFMAAANLMSQIKLNQSQANKNNAEAGLISSQTTGQDWLNQFNQDTTELQKQLKSAEYHKALRTISQIDNQITNDTQRTIDNHNMSVEQINSLYEGRLIQWKQLDLSAWQIGEQIKIGFQNALANLKNASANQQNAAANWLRAQSEDERNQFLNKLTDLQSQELGHKIKLNNHLFGYELNARINYLETQQSKGQNIQIYENDINKFNASFKRFTKEAFGVEIPYNVFKDVMGVTPPMLIWKGLNQIEPDK